MKNSKGSVCAKYVGLPIYGAKKNAIWVPKTLITNIQGPKKIWIPKRVTSLLQVNYKAGGRHWVLDSRCTQHMTGDSKMFFSLDDNVVGYSDIIFGTITISSDHSFSKVLLVDYLKFNLLSVTQLCDFGYQCSFTKDNIVVTSLDGNDHIFTGFRHEDVYLVDLEMIMSTCLFSKSSLGWL